MNQRFLISRLSSLGDVVCTLPAASALKSLMPNCVVEWAVDPRFAGIVECCRAVDVVHRVKPGFSPKTWPSFDGSFEAALDLQGLSKSALVVARADARRTLGYHWQREGSWLCSARVVPDPSSIHVVDQYVDVVRALGAEADRAVFSLVPQADDVASVKSKLASKGVEGRFVVINPGAGWVTKRWPPAHFGAVIGWLERAGLRCVLVGGNSPTDLAIADEVIGHCDPTPVSLTGQTSVRELVALISLAAVHLGGDTGSSHIAAALNVPAVGLYSITRPERTCPYGQIDRCHYDARSLAEIAPEPVLETMLEAVA